MNGKSAGKERASKGSGESAKPPTQCKKPMKVATRSASPDLVALGGLFDGVGDVAVAFGLDGHGDQPDHQNRRGNDQAWVHALPARSNGRQNGQRWDSSPHPSARPPAHESPWDDVNQQNARSTSIHGSLHSSRRHRSPASPAVLIQVGSGTYHPPSPRRQRSSDSQRRERSRSPGAPPAQGSWVERSDGRSRPSQLTGHGWDSGNSAGVTARHSPPVRPDDGIWNARRDASQGRRARPVSPGRSNPIDDAHAMHMRSENKADHARGWSDEWQDGRARKVSSDNHAGGDEQIDGHWHAEPEKVEEANHGRAAPNWEHKTASQRCASGGDAPDASDAWAHEDTYEKTKQGHACKSRSSGSIRSAVGKDDFVVKPYWSSWHKSTAARLGPGGRREPARSIGAYVAEEDPPYVVPEQVIRQQSTSHQVQPGRPAVYAHRQHRPLYIDSPDSPYAVFVFKYRSKGQSRPAPGSPLTQCRGSRAAAEYRHHGGSRRGKNEASIVVQGPDHRGIVQGQGG